MNIRADLGDSIIGFLLELEDMSMYPEEKQRLIHLMCEIVCNGERKESEGNEMKKQWNFPTYDEMAKDVARKVINEYNVEGKTLGEWIEILKEYLESKQPEG